MIGPFDSKRTVVVSNFPVDVGEDELTIHFQKQKNGGGDVDEVVMDGSVAFVIFDLPEGLECFTRMLLNIICGTKIVSVGKLSTQKVQVLSVSEMIKQNSTKVLLREVSTGSRRMAFARNVEFYFIISGTERNLYIPFVHITRAVDSIFLHSIKQIFSSHSVLSFQYIHTY